ncbi:hypothetical protein SAMN06272765_7251 [Streptomyces sp. Ag109_G2-15]|nr:hypothetical protein SAMN06272765_7251 [Streptomyces sp. Ag109_G2-15]
MFSTSTALRFRRVQDTGRSESGNLRHEHRVSDSPRSGSGTGRETSLLTRAVRSHCRWTAPSVSRFGGHHIHRQQACRSSHFLEARRQLRREFGGGSRAGHCTPTRRSRQHEPRPRQGAWAACRRSAPGAVPHGVRTGAGPRAQPSCPSGAYTTIRALRLMERSAHCAAASGQQAPAEWQKSGLPGASAAGQGQIGAAALQYLKKPYVFFVRHGRRCAPAMIVGVRCGGHFAYG